MAHHNLGVALLGQRRLDEAVGAYREAIAIAPDLVEARCNLAVALKHLGKLGEVVAPSRQAAAATLPPLSKMDLQPIAA